MANREIDKIIWENVLYIAHVNHGWDKQELARQSGIGITTLNSIANGTRGIGKSILDRIAKAIGVTVELLLCGKMAYSRGACMVGCDKEMATICRTVKEIRDSGTHWWDSLEKNIDSFKKGLDADRGIDSANHRHAQGSLSGTTETPARRTGSRKKAG